jgi:ABC-type sugar transport system ATPase subunit
MLEAKDIRKSYGGVQALSGAGLTVRAGSVHALLGENGAGKSTLVKVIVGAVRPDSGVLRLNGEEVSFSSTADAGKHGVAAVSQELSLFPDLDVLSNLFPMREIKRGPFIDRKAMERKARPVLAELGLELEMRQPVSSLTLAERQLIEIAKALVTEPRVLILDEPTSALEASSVEILINVLKVLRDREVAVVFVSHILEEVMALCDEVTVLRDGHPVLEGESRAQLSVPSIVDAMLGEKGSHARVTGQSEQALETQIAQTIGFGDAGAGAAQSGAGGTLQLKGVSVKGRLQSIDLEAHAGEILGVAGIAGSGHLTVLELISGQCAISGGEAVLPNGRKVRRSMHRAVGAGVAMVTGDRRRYGLMLDKPIWENIAQVRSVALAREGMLLSNRKMRSRAEEMVERLQVKAGSVDENAGQLSGGNQQKLVFAKWLDAQPSVLLLDDPTRGVDIGAKSEMHRLIRAAAGGDAVVVLASTDLDEIVAVCDRVAVFFEGRICAELSGETLSQHSLLETMNTGRLPIAA